MPRQVAFSSRDELRFGTSWERFPFNPDLRTSGDAHQQAEPTEGTKLVAHLRTHGDFLVKGKNTFGRQALRASGVLAGGVTFNIALTMLFLFTVALMVLGLAHMLSADIAEAWRVTDPANAPGVAGLFGRNVMAVVGATLRDVNGQAAQTALASGVFATLLLLLVFLVATTWWRGPETWLPGQSREDAFEIRMTTLGATLLALSMLIGPIVNAQITAGPRASLSWLAQPFLVALSAHVTAFAAYVLFVANRSERARGSFGLRSLWGSYLALSRYAVLATALVAVLPAACYAFNAVGLKGGPALFASLVSGGLLSLLLDPVKEAVKKLTSSPQTLQRTQGAFVASLMILTIILTGSWAIDMEFADPRQGDAFLVALAISAGALLVLSMTVNFNRIGLFGL